MSDAEGNTFWSSSREGEDDEDEEEEEVWFG